MNIEAVKRILIFQKMIRERSMKGNVKDDVTESRMIPIPTPKVLSESGVDPALGYRWMAPFQVEEVSTMIEGEHVRRKEGSNSRTTIGYNNDAVDLTIFLQQHPFLRGGIYNDNSSIDRFSTRTSLKIQLQDGDSLQQPFNLSETNATIATTSTTNLVSMGSKIETLSIVGAVVGLFGLAIFCFACSMSGRDVWQKCSMGWCCCKKGRPSERSNDTDGQSPLPPTRHYATVQEFVFDAEHETIPALVVDVPTTMEQLFPDLLARSTDDLEALVSENGRGRRRARISSSYDKDEENNGHIAQLCEPLL
jgi:hypothetical protein